MTACFNCGTADATRYSFDPDLPAVEACQLCVFALGQGDEEMLKALRPRRRRSVGRAKEIRGALGDA